MKKKIFCGLAILALAACQTDLKEDVNSQQTALNYVTNDQGETVGEEVILGEERQNAYSVDVMQAAFDYYNSKYSDSPFAGRKVDPTHIYVKILPATEADLLKLEEMSDSNDEYFISEYPMDREVLQEGSDYTDRVYKGQTEFKPLYTVLPINTELGVPYTIIDKLYEPTDEEFHIETIALAMADWQDDLIADFGEAVTMDNVNDFIGAPADETARSNWFSSLFGRKFTPKGKILIKNYDDLVDVPLTNANLNTGRSFWWRGTHTDENGYFEATKRYRGKVRIRSAWRNPSATERMTWLEMIGIQVSDHVMTETRGNNNRTYIIKNEGDDRRLWCKGGVYNGIIKYNKFCAANSLIPVSNANVWVWKSGDGGATPMMKQYPMMSSMASINGWTQAQIWSSIGTTFIGIIAQPFQVAFPHLFPDQIYKGVYKIQGEDKNKSTISGSYRGVEQLVFHESGHFSHALKCGSWTYSKIFAGELKNGMDHGGDPYYHGQSPTIATGQLIALAEGWATLTESKCMQYSYPSSQFIYDSGSRVGLPGYIDNFSMYTTPYTIGNRTDARSWFLTGILWDITDNNSVESNSRLRNGDGSNPTGTQIVDNLYLPGTLSILYNRLDSNTLSGNDLKNRLLTSYSSSSLQINELFTSYGY